MDLQPVLSLVLSGLFSQWTLVHLLPECWLANLYLPWARNPARCFGSGEHVLSNLAMTSQKVRRDRSSQITVHFMPPWTCLAAFTHHIPTITLHGPLRSDQRASAFG